MRRFPTTAAARAGFTLAEVMVTLVIVGMSLLLIIQGVFTARETTFYTYQRKVARELALVTMGHVESGLFWEDLDDSDDVLSGSYSEEGYDEYYWELALGEDEFTEYDEGDSSYFDNFAHRRQLERDADEDEDEDEDAEEPYERVKIRVSFPTLNENRANEIIIERWIPWNQVYGESEEDGTGEAAEGSPF